MSILTKLNQLLGSNEAPVEQNSEDEKLAAAVLMVEVATQDGEFSSTERDHIIGLLERRLDLSKEDALELFVDALGRQGEANHILVFTRKIKDHFDEAGREHILELLWEVVFADGKEDSYESNLMRQITGLLYISDKKNGMIRKKILARRGASSL